MALVKIEADSVAYYSARDEANFFQWLDSIRGVENYYGIGTVLYIEVDKVKLNAQGMRELLAIHIRYNIPMAQLEKLKKPAFAKWFPTLGTYWYDKIYK